MRWIQCFFSVLTGRRSPSFRLAEALAALPEAIEGGTLTTRREIAGVGSYDERVVDFQSVYLQRKM